MRSGEAAIDLGQAINRSLGIKLESKYGLWLIEKGLNDQAMSRYSRHRVVRERWLSKSITSLTASFRLHTRGL